MSSRPAPPCPEPGSSGRPTIRDVARLAGTSTGTVSRVLNAHVGVAASTRDRVRMAIQTLQFQPDETAVGLARRRWS